MDAAARRVAARHRSAQSPMAYKKNANGQHHIPKRRHCVVSWRDDDAGQRRRGSLSLWLTDEAIAAWPFSSAGSMRDGPTPTGGRPLAATTPPSAVAGAHDAFRARGSVAPEKLSGSELQRGESSLRARRVTGQQLAPRPRCLAPRTA